MLQQQNPLHDARLISFDWSPLKMTLTIKIEGYLSEESSERSPADIVFSNVEKINLIVDARKISDNHTSGNINYWNPSEAAGDSYIFLSHGCIVVTAHAPMISWDEVGTPTI